jgi:uncharacterized protein (DUF488 family)
MLTPAFETALDSFATRAVARRTALMCAEAVPWRCHRSLIADALVARGWEVLHITGLGPASAHSITPFARVVDGRVRYDGFGGLSPTGASP